jgi:hypothetical protein
MEGTSRPLATPRTGEVLEASFVEGVSSVPLDELRRRRDVAVVERDFQSYLRRLVQTRQDLLEAERRRRESGGAPQSVVDRVKEALTEGSGQEMRSGARGEAMRVRLSPEDLDQAQSLASGVVAPSLVSGPEAVSDADLEEAIVGLEAAERVISANRAAVFRVHDHLQEELKRRYLEDPALIPTEL